MMKIFYAKFFFTSNTIYGEYMACIDMNEILLHKISNTKFWQMKLMRIMVHLKILSGIVFQVSDTGYVCSRENMCK